MIITLGDESKAFTGGGNRLCFVHPHHPDRCIKVLRPNKDARTKRAMSGAKGLLLHAKYFDDNLAEYTAFKLIEATIGASAFELLPRCYGFVDTDLGSGLCTELIVDTDGKIAVSLKQLIWQHGSTADIQRALQHFQRRWSELGIPSRNLLLHNIVAQRTPERIQRLVVIDGIGWPDFFTLAKYSRFLARRKAKRKAARIDAAIDALLQKKARNGDWGYHGWLDDAQREIDKS